MFEKANRKYVHYVFLRSDDASNTNFFRSHAIIACLISLYGFIPLLTQNLVKTHAGIALGHIQPMPSDFNLSRIKFF